MTITLFHAVTIVAISFFIAIFSIPHICKFCITHKMYDMPIGRKIHSKPIPRLGGIVFFPSILLSMSIALFTTAKDEQTCRSLIYITIGGFMMYLVGVIDDLIDLKARIKFIIQFMASLIFPLCNLTINNLHGVMGIHEIPTIISYPLTVFVILLIVNAFNLIDGIDGLSSGIAILISIFCGILYLFENTLLFVSLCITVLGCLLGFFYHNMWGKPQKSKIFMGDSGSLFLGYIIAYLTIKYQMTGWSARFSPEFHLIVSFTLVYLPCIDTIRVAILRLCDGRNIFDADKTHIHHLILETGLDMHNTLIVILLFYVFLCIMNLLLYLYSIGIVTIALSDCIIYLIIIITAKNMKQKNHRMTKNHLHIT